MKHKILQFICLIQLLIPFVAIGDDWTRVNFDYDVYGASFSGDRFYFASGSHVGIYDTNLSLIDTITIPNTGRITSVAYLNGMLWAGDIVNKLVYKIDLARNVYWSLQISNFPDSLGTDGQQIFVQQNDKDGSLAVIDPTTNNVVRYINTEVPDPTDITFDGNRLVIVDENGGIYSVDTQSGTTLLLDRLPSDNTQSYLNGTEGILIWNNFIYVAYGAERFVQSKPYITSSVKCRAIPAVMPKDVCAGICPSVVWPYAHLSAAAYGDPTIPGGWQVIYDTNTASIPADEKWANFLSGFHAVLYEDVITKKHVLAFEGTKFYDSGDIKTDVIELISPIPPKQYDSALGLVDEFLKNDNTGLNTRDNLVLTGHSLGGGLAQFVARKLGLIAYTFNPAGLSRGTYNYGDSDSTAKITNIVTITTSLEPLWPSDVVSSVGRVYGNTLLLPIVADHILFGHNSLHGIDTIVSNLDDQSLKYNKAFLPRFFSNIESTIPLPAPFYIDEPSSAGMYKRYTNTIYGNLHIEVRNGDVFYSTNNTRANLTRAGTLNEINSSYCRN